jgi:O-antigen ligase
MTTVSSRPLRRPENAVATAGFMLAAIGVGVLTAINPPLGMALAAAFVFALIVVWDLTVGMCLFLLVTFLDVVSRNANLSLTKGAGAVLAASWLATVATRRPLRQDLTSAAPRLTLALIAFLAWSGISAVWAESPGAASRSTLRFALDVMLVPIGFWAVRQRRHVVWVLAVFVLGAILSVLWGLTHGKVNGSAAAAQVGRLSGANVEANVLATLLVVCAIFACALILVLRRAPLARLLAGLAAVVAMVAFFGTFSRGGLLALGVAIVAGCIYGGKSRPAFALLLVGVVLVGSLFLRDTTSGAVARLTSASTSGRIDIWKVGLRMVRAHPIVGVGSGNYTVAEPHYLLTSPGAIQRGEFIIDTPLVAHNIYLHVLAEMGVVGLALFLGVLGLAIRSATRAVEIFRRRGERSLEILGRALVVALAGILAADFFVSDQYSKQLWLLLALGPALLAIARELPEPEPAFAGPSVNGARSLAAGAAAAPDDTRWP